MNAVKFQYDAAKPIDPQTSLGAGIDRHTSAGYEFLRQLILVPEIYGTDDG